MDKYKEILSKYLRILFSLHIVSMAIAAVNAVSNLDSITRFISYALSAVELWCLFQLRDANPRYRSAALAALVTLVAGFFATGARTASLGTAGIVLTVASIASLVASYQEYHAHGETVEALDEKLAKKWNSLFGLEILVSVGISVVSAVATTVLVTSGAATETVTTIILILSTGLGLLLQGLYLLYMKQTLQYLEA